MSDPLALGISHERAPLKPGEPFGFGATAEPEGAGAEVRRLRPREAEGHRD